MGDTGYCISGRGQIQLYLLYLAAAPAGCRRPLCRIRDRPFFPPFPFPFLLFVLLLLLLLFRSRSRLHFHAPLPLCRLGTVGESSSYILPLHPSPSTPSPTLSSIIYLIVPCLSLLPGLSLVPRSSLAGLPGLPPCVPLATGHAACPC